MLPFNYRSLYNQCLHLSLNRETQNPHLFILKKTGIPTATSNKNKCPVRPYLIYTIGWVRKRNLVKHLKNFFKLHSLFSMSKVYFLKSNLEKKVFFFFIDRWTFTDEGVLRISSTLAFLPLSGHCLGPPWWDMCAHFLLEANGHWPSTRAWAWRGWTTQKTR